jgi:hypothetical protein
VGCCTAEGTAAVRVDNHYPLRPWFYFGYIHSGLVSILNCSLKVELSYLYVVSWRGKLEDLQFFISTYQIYDTNC